MLLQTLLQMPQLNLYYTFWTMLNYSGFDVSYSNLK